VLVRESTGSLALAEASVAAPPDTVPVVVIAPAPTSIEVNPEVIDPASSAPTVVSEEVTTLDLRVVPVSAPAGATLAVSALPVSAPTNPVAAGVVG
jgi:hypothetical protein